MATTVVDLHNAVGDISVEDQAKTFQTQLIFMGLGRTLKDKLWLSLIYKTAREMGSQVDSNLIFNVATMGLSSVGPRKLGTEYTPDNSVGQIESYQMRAFGGSFEIDNAWARVQQFDTYYDSFDRIPENYKSYASAQFMSKVDALVEGFSPAFIKGNGIAPNWNGLETFVTSGRVVPKTLTLPQTLNEAGAEELHSALSRMNNSVRINTLICNSVGYRLIQQMNFWTKVYNSKVVIGDVEFTGVDGMKVIELDDSCFTATSLGSGTAVIYGLRMGATKEDVGIVIPDDGNILTVRNPFGPGGSGLAVRQGMVELIGCTYPGTKEAIQLLQITVTPAASGYTNVNLASVGTTDVNIAAVGGTPVTAALPVQAANDAPVQVIVRDPVTPGAFLNIENGAVPTTIKGSTGEPLGTPTNPLNVQVDQTTKPVMKVSLTDQSGDNPYNPSDGLPVRQTADAVPVAVKSMDQRISVGVKNDPRDPVLKTVVADSTGQQTANVADGKLSVNSVT